MMSREVFGVSSKGCGGLWPGGSALQLDLASSFRSTDPWTRLLYAPDACALPNINLRFREAIELGSSQGATGQGSVYEFLSM